MAIKTIHNKTEFGVGDVVRVHQTVPETGKKNKERIQIIEGVVIKIKGTGQGKTFTVRRIGAQKIGVEFIFPLFSPTINKIEVKRKGLRGVRRAKLYYIREKSKKEIEAIYSRSQRREKSKKASKPAKASA